MHGDHKLQEDIRYKQPLISGTSAGSTASILKQSHNMSKTALIIKLGQIGDVIMALPAVHLLHQQGYGIYWACGRAARPLLESYEWITVVPVDDKAILRGSALQRVKGVASFWSKVLFRKYDLCATLYYDRRFHVLTYPIRGRRLTLSHASRETELIAGRHHTDEYARVLLRYEDKYTPRSIPPVPPSHLPPSPLPARKAAKRIALAPGGTSNVLGEQVLRRWPVERYASVAQRLLARGWEIVLIGGPEDDWVRDSFKGLNVVDCLGTLSLPETISACDACDAVITHDTGPLHLAGLSCACVIGIFGPTDPATRVPRRDGAVGIWGGEGLACRPCYDGRTFAPCPFNGCMHEVTPERVIAELDQMFGYTADPGSTLVALR